ncbi:YdcF family protein [Peribacillus simplex]|uniref:YdcF family protein n=1 Tax=Peribacillus simplex TaxID=1478 RepID=A0AAW7IKS3_9BACI|nr:YdcF family protein [Peribacillus simplex]MDM5295734.1 YdcF family protein [Peribacillus simplex]MDM5454740.1 YdcF family protein [Peribacillus simplex]
MVYNGSGTKRGKTLKRTMKFGIIGFVVLLGYFGFLHMKIQQSIHQPIPENANYLIILGARVKGSVPSLSLQYRIDKAAEYLSANEHTVVIVSGGKGPGEDISEAKAMQQGLIAHGIEAARIMMEDKSTTTHENIVFSKELIPDKAASGLIVSNDFHIYRAVEIAKKEGLDIKGIPAKTPKVVLLKSYTREYLAITKYYLTELIGR